MLPLPLPRFLSCLLAVVTIALQSSTSRASPFQPGTYANLSTRAVSTFTNLQVFKPPKEWPSWRTIYAHSLQLPDSSLLLTWEQYSGELETFPIYRSTDGGQTWAEWSQVHDTINGWGLRYQPHLHLLEKNMGGFKKGTILIAGPSVPASLNGGVYIDLYFSTDNAKTWTFASHIAYGEGPETIKNGDKAIWEPFFFYHNGELICYYSDQRDPAYAQKIVYVKTKDLISWSDPVDVVAFPDYKLRPGMPVVAKIEKTGKYIMTFENCGGGGGGYCPVWYTIADSPLLFAPASKTHISAGGVTPNGAPYVTYYRHPRGDGSGVIIANGNNRHELFLNDDLGASNTWRRIDVGMWPAYSRSLRIVKLNGEDKLFIGNGGNMGDPKKSHNFVACGVIDIPKYPQYACGA